MLATEAVQSPIALVRWVAATYDLALPHTKAARFVKQYKSRLSEYNLRLSLKWQLLPLCTGQPTPRPAANPDRVEYPFDNYARTPPVTMYSLLAGSDYASPAVNVARNRLEEIGGYVGELHLLLQLERNSYEETTEENHLANTGKEGITKVCRRTVVESREA